MSRQLTSGVLGRKKEKKIVYGFLYNRWVGYAGTKNIANSGWRMSNDSDWYNLTDFVTNNLDPEIPQTAHLKSKRMNGSPLGGEFDTNINPFWNFNATTFGRDTVNLNIKPGGLRGGGATQNFQLINDRVYLWRGNNIASIFINHNNLLTRSASSAWATTGFYVLITRDATISELSLIDGSYVDDYIGNTGQRYKAVKINTLIWTEPMIETHYNDGEEIPEIQSNADWLNLNTLEQGGRCSYNNDEQLAYI